MTALAYLCYVSCTYQCYAFYVYLPEALIHHNRLPTAVLRGIQKIVDALDRPYHHSNHQAALVNRQGASIGSSRESVFLGGLYMESKGQKPLYCVPGCSMMFYRTFKYVNVRVAYDI